MFDDGLFFFALALIALIMGADHSRNQLGFFNFQLKIADCNSFQLLWSVSGYYHELGVSHFRDLDQWLVFIKGALPCFEGTRKSFTWHYCPVLSPLIQISWGLNDSFLLTLWKPDFYVLHGLSGTLFCTSFINLHVSFNRCIQSSPPSKVVLSIAGHWKSGQYSIEEFAGLKSLIGSPILLIF